MKLFKSKKGFMKDLTILPAIAIIFVMTIIIFTLGIVILGNFNADLSVPVTVTGESFVTPLSNSTVNGTRTLAHQNITSFSGITNGSLTLGPGNYSVNTVTGVITFIKPNQNATVNAVCYYNRTCYATYTYTSYASVQNVAVNNGILALQEIPNNWLLLFAIVIAAGILVSVTVFSLWKAGVGGLGGGNLGGNRT